MQGPPALAPAGEMTKLGASGLRPAGAMTQSFSGHYPIEHRAGEIERLHVQGAAMAPDAAVMLDRIGVAPGWSCLDIGCGPRGITEMPPSSRWPAPRPPPMSSSARAMPMARTWRPAASTSSTCASSPAPPAIPRAC